VERQHKIHYDESEYKNDFNNGEPNEIKIKYSRDLKPATRSKKIKLLNKLIPFNSKDLD